MGGFRISGNCARCGAFRRSLHRDHTIPKWQGGTDEPSNWQDLCANCHQDKTLDELASPEFRAYAKAKQAEIRADPAWQKRYRRGLARAMAKPEYRKNMSDARKGKPRSEETKRRMSLGQQARWARLTRDGLKPVVSEETRQRLSQSHIKSWQRRREAASLGRE